MITVPKPTYRKGRSKMPAVSLLIKPASSQCNLSCAYCFYANVTDRRNIKNYGIMTHSTTEALIKNTFDYAEHMVTFAFQGGEPTLAGLAYFEDFITLVNQYAKKNIDIHYAIQTNGVNVNDAFAAFFFKHKFLVGISLDGPKDIHDLNRKDFGGQGSYKKVKACIKTLDKHKVEYNILSVVNKAVAKHPAKVYNYFKKEGYTYLQFIPCLDELGKPHGVNPYALLPDDYGSFLCTLFDLWYKDFMSGRRISIRFFDNIIQIILGYPPESCDMNGICSTNLVIEADGSTYPCDFYVLDEWNLGNVNSDQLSTLLNCDLAHRFVTSSIDKNKECSNCAYLNVCKGGCRRHKSLDHKGPLELNYFCSTYKRFYSYTLDRFKEIARIIYSELQAR